MHDWLTISRFYLPISMNKPYYIILYPHHIKLYKACRWLLILQIILYISPFLPLYYLYLQTPPSNIPWNSNSYCSHNFQFAPQKYLLKEVTRFEVITSYLTNQNSQKLFHLALMNSKVLNSWRRLAGVWIDSPFAS